MTIYTYISPPSWCKDAVPTERGWTHPKTGELLIAVPGGIPMNEMSNPIIDERQAETLVIDESIKGEVLIDESMDDRKPLIDETINKGDLIKESKSRKPKPKNGE